MNPASPPRSEPARSVPAGLPTFAVRLSLRLALGVAGGVAGAMLAGCHSSDGPSGVWTSDRVRAWPFAPGQVRVHPLSRVQTSPEPLLIVHVEMLDPWGDTTKGIGLLRLVAGPVQGPTMQWDVDLRDAELNASLYDASTRTYRVQLRGVSGGSGPGELRVRAEFVGPGPDGRDRTLTDETTVRIDSGAGGG